MYPLIEDCVQRLETVIMKKATDSSGNNEIELKKFMGNLTMDVIALCAFGTKIDTHNDPNNQFIKNAEVVFRGIWRFWVFFVFKNTIPKILDLIGFQMTDPSVAHFFRSAVSLLQFKFHFI
jgi:cytochrome P450 family 3 subfamily A